MPSRPTRRRLNITTESAVVVAAGLGKCYGRREVVKDVSFSVGPGQVFGLLGPNGSGKSTILRMLVGVLRPDTGHATIAGLDVMTDGPAARAQVGYVPEDIPLYGHSRVDEFLTMMAALKGIDRSHRRHAIDAVIERLSLNAVRRTVIRQLSRGFRQRVAIAQALLGAPPVLVFDEPTNGLDPRQIIECRELVAGLAGTHAVLITSHILSEIEKVADRVAILLDGRLLALEELALPGGARLDLERRFLELTEQRA